MLSEHVHSVWLCMPTPGILNHTARWIGISVLIQILNTIFIFAQITAIMIIFTKDAQKMEQKLVRYNTKLQKIASVDALTGLWNRRSMWEYIRAVEYDYEIGNAGFVSIAIADIDFFKRINDTYGHDAGDEVLKAVAELFMDKMKTYGRVCRWEARVPVCILWQKRRCGI